MKYGGAPLRGGWLGSYHTWVMYTVYILQNEQNRYYIGYTNSLVERLYRHNTSRNISTRHRGPWKVVYTEQHPNRQSAWLREREIKRMKGGNSFKKLIMERWPSG